MQRITLRTTGVRPFPAAEIALNPHVPFLLDRDLHIAPILLIVIVIRILKILDS